jgi:rubrerythrin
MKTETPPPKPTSPDPRVSGEVPVQGTEILDKDHLHALLFEALETEQRGVLVYETALKCAINKELIKEWTEYHAQTKNHVVVLTNVLKQLGLNPDQETPGRNVVRHAGMSLVKTMEVALIAGKPHAAEVVAAECVVQAETKDHLNWELIGAASNSLSGTERQTLKKAFDQVEDEEDEHLYHTTGWARELHLQALGLPAQLPPLEEERDVKTEMEAAEVRKQRKETLASSQKGVRSEETGREKGSGVQRSNANKQKRQNRRSAA